MDILNIPATENTPNIVLNPQSNQFEIGGKSQPEDAASFYEPIVNWVSDFKSSPNTESIFQFKLNYFDTPSSKALIEILMQLEELHEKGQNVNVEWYYEVGEDQIAEAGEEFKEIVKVPFTIYSY